MITNPYRDIAGKKLYKGDIHFHTALSDGASSLEKMLDRLIECGFDFCAPADHDLPGSHGKQDGLTVLACQEMSSDDGHIVALNTQVVREESWSIVEQIKSIRSTGGMAILSHPKIREFIPRQSPTYSADRLINEFKLEFDGMEVFTRNVGSGFKTAIDRLDLVWTALHFQEKFAPVWGFASSDGHHVDHITPDTGIMVWSVSCEPEDLLEAIYAGRFFSIADTKVRFEDIAFDGRSLKAVAANCRQIKVVKAGGEIAACHYFQAGNASEMIYDVNGDEVYLRLEAHDENGRGAYSNPLRISG